MKNLYVLTFTICLTFIGCKKSNDAPVYTPIETELETIVKDGVDLRFNPYNVAPLSAEARFETIEPCVISVSVTSDEKPKALPIKHTFDKPNTKFKLPILGFYAGVNNQVELVIKRANGDSAVYRTEIRTKSLPEEVMTIEVVKYNKELVQSGLNLALHSVYEKGTNNLKYIPLMWDSNGDVRWVLDLFAGDFATDGGISGCLNNGNFISLYVDQAREYNATGELVSCISFSGYNYHHDYCELPNGNLLFAVDKQGLSTIEDHVIEVDGRSGALIKEYDLRPLLDPSRAGLGGAPNDWFHNNSVWYDAADNSIILSGQRQGVIKIDRATGKLKWIMSPHKDWNEQLKPYLLTAVDDNGSAYESDVQYGRIAVENFDWGWGQHNVTITPRGTLLMFDNGFNRNYSYPSSSNYSRIVEYKIDETKKQIQQVWQFGYQRPEYVSFIISSAAELDNGNRLMSSGTSTPQNNWDRGKMVELKGDQVVFEATYYDKNKGLAADMTYRTIRKELYND